MPPGQTGFKDLATVNTSSPRWRPGSPRCPPGLPWFNTGKHRGITVAHPAITWTPTQTTGVTPGFTSTEVKLGHSGLHRDNDTVVEPGIRPGLHRGNTMIVRTRSIFVGTVPRFITVYRFVFTVEEPGQ